MAAAGRKLQAGASVAKKAVEDRPQSLLRSQPRLRDPPPALFLHPSPAASYVSLPGILSAGAPQSSSGGSVGGGPSGSGEGFGTAGTAVSAATPRLAQRQLRAAAGSSHSNDRADSLWAEMQTTLEEVEVSASGSKRVFGPEHDRRLAALRTAQIALAHAWARSEADDVTVVRVNTTGGKPATGTTARRTSFGSTDRAGVAGDGTARSTAGSNGGYRPGSSGGIGPERLGAKLEEETEADILMARLRRDANDRYFHRVNRGVVDVIACLDEVAAAMRDVEQDSKDIWSGNEGVPESETSQQG